MTFLRSADILLKKAMVMVQFFLHFGASFSVAVMWNKTSVFLFDSHSSNDHGFHDPNGKVTLHDFRPMISLNNILITFY